MPTKNWPHPVLDMASQDYPNCAFQSRLEIKQTKIDYRIHADLDLGCETLQDAISLGNAEFVVHVSCARTAYREFFPSQGGSLDFSIAEHELRDSFVVTPYVVSKASFDLQSGEFASVFQGLSFPVSRGAVLAVAPSTEFVAEKVFDELKNISAIFEVIRHLDEKSESVEYDLNRNKIAIVLPHKVYSDYRVFRARSPYRELFVCTLVLPGLSSALAAMAGSSADSDAGDSLRWRRVIRRRLNDMHISSFDADDTFVLAQRLLELPFGRAFQAIRNRESEEN